MASPGYLGESSQVRGDPYFTEIISQKMRVPARLRVGHDGLTEVEKSEDMLPVYSMHVPERLALTGELQTDVSGKCDAFDPLNYTPII